MNPIVIKRNWYGFDHDEVAKRFEGDLSFVNTFCVNGEYSPVAVYRAASPNVKKGHKKYMLLQTKGIGPDTTGIIRGMTEEEMEKWRYQDALHCLNCNSVTYSINRHDMTDCYCKNHSEKVWVDGGRDYTSCTYGEEADYELGRLDLLTDTFTKG